MSLPPQSETLVYGNTSVPFLGEGLVETNTKFLKSDRGVLVARCVVKPATLEVPLRLLNITNETKIVHKSTCVGKLTNIGEVHDQSETLKDSEMDVLLENLLETSTSNLDESQRVKVRDLLLRKKNAFMEKDGKLGRTNIVTHKIDTGDSPPIRQRPYRLPYNKREEVDKQIKSMLDEGIISPSFSPWASPIVLVEKSTPGEFRLCVDYRKVNNCSNRRDAYTLPLINESLQSLSGASYFSSLDLCQGYHQMLVDPKDREKTAFIPGYGGLYEYNVLPFGLAAAPSSLERLMELVLAGLHWKICLIYLDDILVYSSTFDEHIDRLDEVLSCLIKAGLKLKPSKCKLFQREIKFLGHVVNEKGVSCDPSKLDKVKNWPTPKSVKQVKQFLGLASVL